MYAISFLEGMVFYSSISTLYRQAVGISVFQMMGIETVSWVLSFALEIPWGILADRIGYRRVMVICNAVFFASKIVFWRADSLSDFMAERVMLAFVGSGLSGVDSSFIYLSAGPERSQRAFGIYGAMGSAGVLVSSGVYALFLGDDYRMAAFLTVISYFFMALLTFGLREVRPAERGDRTDLRASLRILRETVNNRSLLALTVAFGLLGEACHMVTVVLNQLQYTRSGMSSGAISLVYMVMTASDFLVVLSAPLTKRLGTRRTGTALFTVCAVSCAVLAATSRPAVSVAGVLLVSVGATLLSPLASRLENDAITVSDRATALSMCAIIGSLLSSVLDLFFGWLADVSLPLSLLFGGAVIAAGGVLFLTSLRGETGKQA